MLPLVGIVDTADTESATSHDIDALLIRTAPVEQWAIQIAAAHRHAQTRNGTIQCDDLTIDLTNRTVYRGTTRVKITPKLWQILHMLARHAPHPVPREHIARTVWNSTDTSAFASINVAVGRLRVQLGGLQYIEAGGGFIRLAVTPKAPPLIPSGASPPATPSLFVALPAPTTPFIGRAADRATLRHMLDQHTRMITLVGSAGVGKTRLALQVAHDVQNMFPTIAFLKLDDLATAEQVLVRLARILDVHVDNASHLLSSVLKRLRQHATLLIVDNAEHLIADVAMLVAQLLHDAAPLSVLATSREPLDIYGEQRFAMQPLSLPDLQHPARAPALDIILSSEAVQLFVARAKLLQPQLTPNTETSHIIARICQHLNGVPLEIELAAAQSDQIALADMEQELTQQHLNVLVSTTRDRTPRQRTVRDAIAWSYTKLTDVEQSFFRHLGSFATDFTTEAAHAVWSGAGTIAHAHQHLQMLARKSLLVQQETNGEARWGMLYSIRAYAHEQLAQHGEQEAAYRRRLAYYQTLLEEADEGLIQTNRAMWMERLEQEYPTIEAVLRAADQEQNARALQQIAGAIWRFWMARGTIRAGRRWCARALHDCKACQDTQCDPDHDAETLRVLARAWNGAGALAMLDEDNNAAQRFLTHALQLYARADNLLGMARTTMNLGLVARSLGNLDQASTLLQESLALYQKLNDSSRLIGILFNLSDVDIALQRYTQAETRLHTVLDLCQEFGDARFAAAAYETLGDLATLRDDYSTAQTLYEHSCAQYRTTFNAADVGRLQTRMVASNPQSDNAFDLLQQIFFYINQTQDMRIMLYGLTAFSWVLLTTSNTYAAAQIWGAAGALQMALSTVYSPFEQHTYAELDTMLVNTLGTTTTQTALSQGAAMPYHDLLIFVQHLVKNHACRAAQEVKML